MEIINLRNNAEYLREYIELCSKEWGTQCNEEELKIKVDRKLEEIITNKNNKVITALGLINDNKLMGFISLFREDGDERKDLTPWYAQCMSKKNLEVKDTQKYLIMPF